MPFKAQRFLFELRHQAMKTNFNKQDTKQLNTNIIFTDRITNTFLPEGGILVELVR